MLSLCFYCLRLASYPRKARKSRQNGFCDKTAYVWALDYRWRCFAVDERRSRNLCCTAERRHSYIGFICENFDPIFAVNMSLWRPPDGHTFRGTVLLVIFQTWISQHIPRLSGAPTLSLSLIKKFDIWTSSFNVSSSTIHKVLFCPEKNLSPTWWVYPFCIHSYQAGPTCYLRYNCKVLERQRKY